MSKVMVPFGQRLRALRKEKGLKQKEMADILGCTDRNYQKMEYGDINVPGLTLMKLADFFDVSIDYLVGQSGEGCETMEIKMPVLAQRLKLLRSEKGTTQKEMAEMLGKTSRHYQDIESGKINVPGLALIKLADFFDVSIDYLVGRSEER